MAVVLIHLVLLPIAAWTGLRVWRGPTGRRLMEAATGTVFFGLFIVASAAVTLDVGAVFFGLLQALAWLLFVYAPGLLLLGAVRSGGAPRWVGVPLALLLVAIGVDAVLIEPFALQVERATVVVPGLSEPIRVALVADLQTDHVGDHERAALAAVAAANPHLVVFAGDYIQLEEPDEIDRERAALGDAIRTVVGAPPLGAFAVQGDVDLPGWPDTFANTGVRTATAPIEQRSVGPVDLVLLDLETSRAPLPALPPGRGDAAVTIVAGHRPDFSLGLEDAGPNVLMLAGHTHGGQVQLPGIGPLITFSNVDRDRAQGVSTLAGGATLVVSAGVGLERSTAPRLRFFCPPEVWIVDLVPGD
mgnify:FL=1